MTFRSKVTLLCALCILYIFVFTLPQLRSTQSDFFSEENDNIVDFETSWRWHRETSLTPPPYSSPTINPEEQSELELGYIQPDLETPPPSPSPSSATVPVPVPFRHDPDEKFITFFTHSGFQNQLIQVENGILLAWYLNRTLILPRALMGEAFGWSYFDKLHLEHMLRDPSAADPCSRLADAITAWEIECPDRTRYTVMPFDDIFDLSWAKQHVRIILRDRSDFDWFESEFDIHRAGVPNRVNGSYVDGDILFFKGETRYDWRIFDTPRKSHRLGKYAESLDIFQLRKRNEKLIHFSSLFGTGKLPIRRPEHYDFLRTLQRSITYRHPAVLNAAERIVELMGGAGDFIGLHVRSSDGWFVKALPENVLSIVSQINREMESRQRPIIKNVSPPTLNECLQLSRTSNMSLIYLATDARSPRTDPAFRPLWETYPCTFTMDDVLAPDSPDWAELDALVDSSSGSSLRRFFLPLVDASVASRGWNFIGSKGSTFSGYIYRLHDVFWSSAVSQTLSEEQPKA